MALREYDKQALIPELRDVAIGCLARIRPSRRRFRTSEICSVGEPSTISIETARWRSE
jgi:hypothetical protein